MRIFICQAVPNNFVKNYNVSQAATTFCFDLINNACFDKAFSIIPVNIHDNIKNKCENKYTEFIQVRTFPQVKLFKHLNGFIENVKVVFKSLPAKKIWFYNVTPSNFVAVFILRFFLRKQVYAIVADHNPPTKVLSVNSFIQFITNRLHGLITLSARGNLTNSNMDFLAGVIPKEKIGKNEKNLLSRKFLFSGVLNKVKGIDMAIEVFSKIPEAELIISGRGDDELIEKVRPFNNIKYLGFLSQEEYRKIFSEITFCLNFRNPALPENENNFPSKILEYFLYDKVVVSTIEYPEIESFKYYYMGYNQQNLIALIKKLCTIDDSELIEYANHSIKLATYFSEDNWKAKIEEIEQR